MRAEAHHKVQQRSHLGLILEAEVRVKREGCRTRLLDLITWIMVLLEPRVSKAVSCG